MDDKKGRKTEIKKYLTVPNVITSFRIVGSIVLLFFAIDSLPFYILYGACGVSDALDGFIARRTHSTTSFGRKLDSAADLIFYATMGYKMFFPLVETLKRPILIIVISLTAARLAIYLFAAIRLKIFLSSHSLWNKATGLIVFMIPYTIGFKEFFFYYSILGCTVAAIAVSVDFYRFIKMIKGTGKNGGEERDAQDE